MQRLHNIKIQNLLVMGLLALLVMPTAAFSQPTVKLGNYFGCSNTEVLLPVSFEKFEDVAAITLYIGVNTDLVEFVDVENINEIFSSTGDFLGEVNQQNQVITLTWFSTTAVNLAEGTMCSIRLLLKGDAVALNFQSDSEIGRSDLSVINNVEYVDGSLISLGSISVNPITQTLSAGSEAIISVTSLPDQTTCQWQVGDGDNWENLEEAQPYSGVQTSQLTIHSVAGNMNGRLFRCLLTNGDCTAGSQTSELLVPSGVNGQNGDEVTGFLRVFPNPADRYLNCIIFANSINRGTAALKVVNMLGNCLIELPLIDLGFEHEMKINTSDLNAGIYFVQFISEGRAVAVQKFLKY
jgi:hypothetical protein